MKHSILTYSLLTAAIAFSAGCNTVDKVPAAKPAPAPAAKVPAAKPTPAPAPKKLDPAAQKRAEEEAKKKAEREAKRKADEAFRTQYSVLRKLFDEMEKKNMYYTARIAECKKQLAAPQNATPILQKILNEKIIDYCQTPAWMTIARYDYSTANTEVPFAAKNILDNPKYLMREKLYAISKLAMHYCDRQMFSEAEALVKKYLADPDAKNYKANLLCTLAHVYRLEYKYDLAMSTAREAMKLNKEEGARTAADIALGFGKLQDAIAVWDEAKDPYGKLQYFGRRFSRYQEDYYKTALMNDARAFLKDLNNRPEQRFEIASQYLFDAFGTAEESMIRRSLTGIPAQYKRYASWGKGQIGRAFQMGDYPLASELCDIYAGSSTMADAAIQRIQVISLGATGKKAEAAKLAATYAAVENLKPIDQMRLKFYSAILSGKSTDDLLKGATLTRKEQSQVLLSAARQCLTWGMSELSEKYSAAYDTYFAKKPNRVMTVKFSDTPIRGISDWRKIYSKLDKQVCDIKFQGSMNFLETDVSTGNRSINFEKNSKNADRMDVSAICDKYGLHIFLHVASDKAHSIENGFANGIGTEMYFAPGRNQPYICMGSNPAKGVTFMFQTTYNNRNHKRPDLKNPQSFRQEVEFTDKDYVLHMFFAWDDYYSKLPENGSEYRFECISWCPDGGYSWGGSQGIHSASSWGSLKFELTDKQLNAIRRNLIFKYCRNYATMQFDPGVTGNRFEFWKDSEVGDPEFYKNVLEPLKKKLADYAAMVKEDMSDADVAKVYTEALPLWMGLPHEVDQLRRKYMTEHLLDAGK